MLTYRLSPYLIWAVSLWGLVLTPLRADDPQVEQARAYIQRGELQEAETLLGNLLKAYPRNFEARRLLGFSYARERRFAEAIRQLNEATQLNPNSSEALTELGELYLRINDRQSAVTFFTRSLAAKPDQPTVHYSLGMLSLEAADYRQAAVHLEQARVYGLNHSGVLLNLCRAYLSLKRLDDALEVASQVLRATAEDWRTQLGVGKMLFENLLYDDAKLPLDRAWQLNPDSFEAGFYRALVRYLLGDQAESLKALLELRPKNPQSLDVKNLTAAVYAKLGRTGEAVNILKETIEAAPDQPDAYLNLGLILLEAGEPKEARGALEQGGARYTGKGTVFYTPGTQQACSDVHRSLDEAYAPKHIEQAARDRAIFYLQLGRAFEERFHYTSAAELLRIGWELDPDNFDILLTLGISCYNLDDLSSSVAMFRRTVSLRPDSDKAYYFLGNTCASLGNDDEAVRAYRQAIRFAPQNPVYLYRLGKVLFRNGQTDEALAAYRSALSLSPDEATIHSALGKAYLRLKQEDLALSEFREAIRLSPGLPEPYYNLAQYYGRKGQAEQANEFAAAFARKTAIARRTPGQYAYIRARE